MRAFRACGMAIALALGITSMTTVLAAGAAPGPGTELIAGRYNLQGVREVGAELELRSDGSFDFGIAYGGVDQSARGRWSVAGKVVTLVSNPTPPAGLSLIALSPTLLDRYGTEPDKPTLLVVKVSTPRLDMNWSNMEVMAEFSNGQKRGGVTGRTGMLGFLERAEPEWKGAVVQRVSVAYPKANVEPVWFTVDPRTTKSIEVNFEPGPMAPQAFERAQFRLQRDSSDQMVLIQESAQGPGKVGWRFIHQ
jgi:hypothetical protein